MARTGRRTQSRRLLALLVITGLLGSSVIVLRDPALRLGGESLLREWWACLAHGAEPGPQTAVAAAYARHAQQQRQRGDIPVEAVDALPIVTPREHVPAALLPHPDRPASLPRRLVVAVVDSGVSDDHPDLADARILPGVDVVNPCGDGRQDVTGHGTAVAGVLASAQHGAAPDVDILPVRISLATGKHHSWASAAGIVAAARRGADVINMSYTNQKSGPSLVEWLAIRYAHSQEVALVAAAGNNPHLPVGYPAAYPSVLSVTAVDGRGELSSYAARMGSVDVAAPGSRVMTLSSDGAYRTASGTSLAAPIVSASLTHLLQTAPSLSGTDAVAAVRESSRPTSHPTQSLTGIGAFNLSNALAGVCRLAQACHFSAVLHRPHGGIPPIGDPARQPVPGEPR